MTSPPSTEQLLVQVLVRALDEALSVTSGVDADAPAPSEERSRVMEELGSAFPPVWLRLSRLELRCMSDGIWWEGDRVLTPDEARSALAPTLVSSGIQALILEPGAERGEVRMLLDLVRRKADDELGELDLVVMLFEADLHHVGYSVDAPAASTQVRHEDRRPPPSSPAAPDEVRATVRAEAARTDERGVVQVEKFDSTLYFLDEREIEYLRFAVEKQYGQDHARSVLALLLDTLQLRSESDVRDEIIDILRTFLPYLLGSGRFTSLAYLTDELTTVVRTTELEPRHRAALDRMRLSLSERGTLTQLLLALEDGQVTPTARSLGTLLRQLDRTALETVLVWGGQLRRPQAKAAMAEALEALFRELPDQLERILSSDDRAVLHRALLMAGRLRAPELVKGIGGALDHEDAAIRKLAVRVLAAIPGTPAMREVARVLADSDAGVRKEAYQAFLSRPYRGAAGVLREVFEAAELEALDLTERKLLFSAFGAVAGPGGVEDLAPILAGRAGFGRRLSSETRACAALGLERIETPEATSALEAAARYRDPLIRSAAAAALRRES